MLHLVSEFAMYSKVLKPLVTAFLTGTFSAAIAHPLSFSLCFCPSQHGAILADQQALAASKVYKRVFDLVPAYLVPMSNRTPVFWVLRNRLRDRPCHSLTVK